MRVLVVVYDFLFVNLNFVPSLIRILYKCSKFVLSLIGSLLLTSHNSVDVSGPELQELGNEGKIMAGISNKTRYTRSIFIHTGWTKR